MYSEFKIGHRSLSFEIKGIWIMGHGGTVVQWLAPYSKSVLGSNTLQLGHLSMEFEPPYDPQQDKWYS